MNAKLVKIDYQFFLYDADDNLIATTEYTQYQRLSMKNCQAIERGYDLDELADKYYGPGDYGLEIKTGFIKGFEVAMRLMGDKKFSEEDMLQLAGYISVMAKGCEIVPSINLEEETNKFINPLQQTEWDVEVVMDKRMFGGGCYKIQPKLDADGCLILKRI